MQKRLFTDPHAEIIKDILVELKRAKELHPSWSKHMVARAGIVSEEAGELIRDAINFKYQKKRHPDLSQQDWIHFMRKEAIQVAAAAIRFIENLK